MGAENHLRRRKESIGAIGKVRGPGVTVAAVDRDGEPSAGLHTFDDTDFPSGSFEDRSLLWRCCCQLRVYDVNGELSIPMCNSK
jgi:hypothetical protein